MIIDSSALIAILRGEPEARSFAEAIKAAGETMMAAPTYLETCQVFCARKGSGARIEVDRLIQSCKIEIAPFDRNAANLAIDAYFRFGKGRGHPAQLNFGDCISYAVSKLEMMPLLFKGNDFRHTDVEAAL